MTGIRRLAAAAMAAGLLVALSGCGSDNGSKDGGGNAVAALTQANFSQTVTAAQQRARSAHMDASVKATGQTVSISGDVSGFSNIKSVSMDMTVALAGKHIEMRLVHKVLYLWGAGVSTNQSKPWVKIDLSDPNNPLSKLLQTASPNSFTAYLQAVKKLKDDGTETVDGVSAHHYTITIDTAKAMAANSALKGQDISKLGLPAQLTTNVWLNSDNLPVKIAVKVGKLASFEAHFSKYGEPVSVQAPPSNKVATFHLGA